MTESYGFYASRGAAEILKFKEKLPAGYFSYAVEGFLIAFADDFNEALKVGRTLEQNKYIGQPGKGKNFTYSIRTSRGHEVIKNLQKRANSRRVSISSYVEWAVVRGIRNHVKWDRPTCPVKLDVDLSKEPI